MKKEINIINKIVIYTSSIPINPISTKALLKRLNLQENYRFELKLIIFDILG